MSGECEICGDHCLDCKCERLPSGLVKTKYAVKMKPCIICIVSEVDALIDKLEKEKNDYRYRE